MPSTGAAGERISLCPSGSASQLGGVALLDTRELVFEHVPFLGDYPQQEPGIDCAYHWPGAVPGRILGRQDLHPRRSGVSKVSTAPCSASTTSSTCWTTPRLSHPAADWACFIEAAHARTATEMTGNERRKLITSML